MGFHPGMKIRLARQIEGLTQEELATKMAEYTGEGEKWTRDVIANIENQRKKIGWETVLAFAYVQDRPLEFYLIEPGAKVPGTNLVIPGQSNRRHTDRVIPWGQRAFALSGIVG